MSEKEGTYASLMEVQQAKSERPTKQPLRPEPLPAPFPSQPELSSELDDLTEVGYRSHSYRFTTAESHWLKSRCLQLSVQLDRTVTHNELVRVLLRVADDAMRKNPEKNDLLNRLSRIKD